MSSQELRKSFLPSYFSMEDIIASQTRVPCTTNVAITKFGFLDPSQESENLPKGCEVELPVWAARAMCRMKPPLTSVKIPKYFNAKFREVLKADPAVVDLNKMGPQYYQAGLQICSLPNEDAEQVSEVLPLILQKRLLAMNDAYSLNRDLKSTDDTISKESGTLNFHHMDPLELQIFNDSKQASATLDQWFNL